MDTLSREKTLSKQFYLPSEKGSTLKGKNLLPLGANSFLLEQTPFQKGYGKQESKLEVIKVVSLVKNGRKSTSVSCSLNCLISSMFVHWMIGISQQSIWEAWFQQIHCQERRFLNNLKKGRNTLVYNKLKTFSELHVLIFSTLKRK